MKHVPDEYFYKIVSTILKENISTDEWALIESDDMFQEGNYEGGFDATEMKFCFSVYIVAKEYWFQLSLDTIQKINSKEIKEVEIREADY